LILLALNIFNIFYCSLPMLQTLDPSPATPAPQASHLFWIPGKSEPLAGVDAIRQAIFDVNHPIYLIEDCGQLAVATNGRIALSEHLDAIEKYYPLQGYVPALPPENLGDPQFKSKHGLRYAYVAGAMANGITSTAMVEAMARSGMIGFFGSAGLLPDEVGEVIAILKQSLPGLPHGFNLIHSPQDPDLEMALVRLYLKNSIRLISASAYLDLTLPLVYYRVKGIYRQSTGEIICPNKIIAKVSRREVARKFFAPPPEKLLGELIQQDLISQGEAELARAIPMADDLTAEADSGGHTDNQPALILLPTLLTLRDEYVNKYQYQQPICVGLGGGIATPDSTAAAFAMGAAYVLTGSINQACIEAGTSDAVRQMLCDARQADIMMAPAADMFEMGVKVQVLKRATMFPLRAEKLYKLYNQYNSFDQIPAKEKTMIERDYLRCSFGEAWHRTKAFFQQRDPKQIQRAEDHPKHKMALVFRSYLGLSSRWAKQGEASRKIDYQIWCGPAMGAFNEWVKGSFLEKFENRKTCDIALNLLYGAAIKTRINWLRAQGVHLPVGIDRLRPIHHSELTQLLNQ
jgi:PfaD family protein